jgi:hypothetical protein
MRLDEARRAFVVEGTVDRAANLGARFVRIVLLVDAGLRLDDLAERPEGDAVAVREAPSLPPRDELRIAFDDPRELVDEAALPIPGTPTRVRSWDDRDWRARRSASPRTSSSCSRPIRGARALCATSMPGRERTFTACRTSIGCDFPLASTAGTSW